MNISLTSSNSTVLSKVLTASVPVGQDYALLSIAPAFLTVQQGTSTGGNSATTLNDTRQTWSPNQWAGLTLEITGGTGAGQVTKILNNMVLFETVNALAEAVAVAKRNGVDPALLLETLSKGSADSFALRNHGLKAIVPGNFPERAFSTEYALKDLSYALELAKDAAIRIRGAELIGQVLQEAIDAGSGDAYFPVIAKHLGS